MILPLNVFNQLLQHAFSVVRSANSTAYNYVDPVRRDTVNIGFNNGITSDNVTIRFFTDNAGPWFLHWYVPTALQGYIIDCHHSVILTSICKGQQSIEVMKY